MIDRNTIINSIPYPIKSFFEIESIEFENNEQYQTAIKAFITAVDIINSHCHINKKVALFFGARQMQIDIDGIPFSYHIPQPALHLHIRNFIYLNVVESSTLSYESQVGAYLEELVHAFMNARNEELTHKIVELLYPCVKHSAEYGFVKR